MDMHPPTDDELHDYPHVFLTADSAWNPAYMNGEFPRDLNSDIILTDDKLLQNLQNARDPHVDAFGNLTLHFLDFLQDGTHSSKELFHDNYKHTKLYMVFHLDRCLDTITIFGTHMMTEFRQPLQVQSHLEMPGILVQLGHIPRT